MQLSGFLDYAVRRENSRRLTGDLASGAQPPLVSCIEPAKPFLLAALHHEVAASARRPVFVVTSSTQRARDLVHQIQSWLGDVDEVLFFPEPEPLFYERLPAHPSTLQDRLR